MFEVMATRFHAAMQTFVPLIDCFVRIRSLSLKALSAARQRALGAHQLKYLSKRKRQK